MRLPLQRNKDFGASFTQRYMSFILSLSGRDMRPPPFRLPAPSKSGGAHTRLLPPCPSPPRSGTK